MTVRGANRAHEIVRYHPDSDIRVELSWFGLTDIGRRRETNEDSLVTIPPLFAIADGMGGHSVGEVASAAVVERLAELGGWSTVTPRDIDEALQEAVTDIAARSQGSENGAGTTVTGVVFGGLDITPTWKVFNIGDSRVYQFFQGALNQITVDHSIVQHLIDTGAITEEEAEHHPHANVITRAVGFNEPPVPDYTEIVLVPGQRLLLCSDGLTKELTELGIAHFLEHAATAEDAARLLMEQSLANSGRDNITVIVIDVHAVHRGSVEEENATST